MRWMFLTSLLLAVFPAVAGTLVIAPHPDDDVITCAGVIYKAVLRGEPVRVVFMTNGDEAGLPTGLIRQGEAVSALVNHLGVPEVDSYFLGYPDAGLRTIWTNYTQAADVYTSPWTDRSATYGNRGWGGLDYHTARFGAPAAYNRPNIVLDLRDILGTFLPDQIFVTAEIDAHPDHSATYDLLRLALTGVFADHPGYNPTLHKTVVWRHCGLTPNALDPTTYFNEIPDSCQPGLPWMARESLDVAPALQSTFYPNNNKYQAIGKYNSQGSVSGYLGRSVHKDEFFWVEQGQGANRPPVVNAGSDQTAGEGAIVSLDGSASLDPDAGPITYQWRQFAGLPVQLNGPTTAHPSFTAPAGLLKDETLTFELVVGDGTFTSVPDAVNVTVTSPLQGQLGVNVASQASLQTSSETEASPAIRAIDGIVDGYPGDFTKEWVTRGEGTGAWIRLTWPAPVTIGRIVLFDRPNANDYIVHGTLSFSDGSTIGVGPLDNWGRDAGFDFAVRTVTSVRFDIDQVGSGTLSVGLSEFKVFQIVLPGGNRPPVANAGADQTVNESAPIQLNGAASNDQDGDPITYQWTQTGGQSVTLSSAAAAQPTFVSPPGLVANEMLTFRLVVNDGRMNGASDFVNISITASNPQTVGNMAPLATATASSENTVTSQTAAKSIDGVIDGYPGNYTREWSTNGEGIGAWLNLAWPSAQIVNKIVLYDRPNSNDQITAGNIVLSDGSILPVGPLGNSGGATTYSIALTSITSLRLNVTGVSATTQNIGLAEIQVFGTCQDADSDGTCNVFDCAPNDPAVSALPGEVSGVTVSTAGPTHIAWSNLGQAARYDVISGLVTGLRLDGGANSANCVTSELSVNHWDDGRPDPTMNVAYYYLVRARNTCGSSGYGVASGGSPRTPSNPCP